MEHARAELKLALQRLDQMHYWTREYRDGAGHLRAAVTVGTLSDGRLNIAFSGCGTTRSEPGGWTEDFCSGGERPR